MPRYHFEPGEVRYVWLDEGGERTSPYHRTIDAAYTYRRALMRVLTGERVWSRVNRATFEPQGSGKEPVRLAKFVMAMQECDLDEEEQLDVAAAERLARSRTEA